MTQPTLTTPRRFQKVPTHDTTVWRAGQAYASALLGAAKSAGQLEAVVGELESLVHDVFDKLPKLEALLSSQFVEQEAKVAMLERAFKGKATPVFLNFLRVVANHGRLDLLRIILLNAHDQLDGLLNRVRVLVSTATALDASAEQRIAGEIRGRLKREPILDKQVHPELIGGIVLRVGDTVYDGSIATRLELIREQMIHRSVHEIQSRRDRFSSAEGN
jgi:F-type H+-transporting ATPase subunit delta